MTVRDLASARKACRELAAQGALGFVPTMGALHAGHLSLVAHARRACSHVAVSIFVNPLQFGAHEDLSRYPRDEEGDARRLAAAGADLLLLTPTDEMYPPGFVTRVTQPGLVEELEGEQRPGHFEGVLTVVAKLLNLVRPEQAFFGHKDYQQAVLVRRMAADLALDTTIVTCPTVRDGDGLALSSRNAYLDAEGRRRGLSLVAALGAAQQAFAAGERSVPRLEARLHEVLREGLGREPDYAVVRAPDLSPSERAEEGHVALVAGRVGSTRLLDNHVLGAKLGPFVQAG
jgi:pantoate--beta-alanine ligase